MSEKTVIYINGHFKDLKDANISVLDQGFLLGDAVFDVVSAWNGKIFKLEAHLDRFQDSIKATRLCASLDREGWKNSIIETVKRNNLIDASIRFIATRGVSNEVIADPRKNNPTEIIWAAPYVFLADTEGRQKGIKLMISHLRGFSPDTLDPRYKCVNRLHFQLAKIEALEAGYDDLIWLDQNGHVSEGPASNIFIVKNGVLHTPVDGVLRGITRQVFTELAGRIGVEVRMSNISSFDLFTADEIFTTSTAGGALFIREVSGRTISDGGLGPITKKLDDLYWKIREDGEDSTAIYD
tara:strand:+ start:332 stop:1219 length:888 start_codon:yes stop_codon:yes gene_type:complete